MPSEKKEYGFPWIRTYIQGKPKVYRLTAVSLDNTRALHGWRFR